MRKQIAITIDENILNYFKICTKENGMTVSGRIEVLIRKDLEKNGINVDQGAKK